MFCLARVGRLFFFPLFNNATYFCFDWSMDTFFLKQTKTNETNTQNTTRNNSKSDDELFWNPNHNSQENKEQRFREESIPSMHFNPINANSQRAVFEHMNHGPVPVRGAVQPGKVGAQSPSMESRHFIHQSASSFRPFQGVAGQRPHSDSPFHDQPSIDGQFQPQVRVQGDGSAGSHPRPSSSSSSHGVVPLLFRQQQTQPPPQQQHQTFSERPVPFTAFSKQPNTRLPNNNRPPVLTAPQFPPNNPTTMDDFDGSNDELPSPTLDWNQQQQQPQRQAQQTLRPGPPRYKDMYNDL
jgi:hypothetical protein